MLPKMMQNEADAESDNKHFEQFPKEQPFDLQKELLNQRGVPYKINEQLREAFREGLKVEQVLTPQYGF